MSEQAPSPIPMTILSGFLGASKTTLLNHILNAEHGLKVAVLVNDFGAINIDAQLVVGVEGETVNLSNGCICCTIRGDLLNETIKLLRRPNPPEYIIVETSGVSDPVAVANTFLMPEVSPLIQLDSILVVVDTDQLFDLDQDNADLAFDQISVADIIVLNKVDLVAPEALSRLKEEIETFIPTARVLEATYGNVPLELVLGVGRYAPEQLHQRGEKDIHVHGVGEDHDHDHSMVFSTWSWSTDKPLSLKALRRVIDALPNTIYRSKGVVFLAEVPERMVVFQMVGKRASLTLADEWVEDQPRTQIVVISAYGGIDAEKLQAQFDSCIVTKSAKKPAKAMPATTAWSRA